MILLQQYVAVFLFLEGLLSLLLLFAAFHSITILRHWNFSATTPQQYRLEKRSYLVVLIIAFTFSLKIILLPYFAHMLDSLSELLPGAMCAAGVINANDYGNAALLLKIGVLFMAAIWLLLNRMDLQAVDYPYFRLKLVIFLVIVLLILFENTLELLYLTHISTEKPVACCSVIFGAQGVQNPLPFGLSTMQLLGLYYLTYLLGLVSAWFRMHLFSFAAHALLLYLGAYALIYFFGTYIYELPTHLCPYCMLQSEYYHIGYLLWGSLFAGTFFGMAVPTLGVLTQHYDNKMYRYAMLFSTLFMLICSGYVLRYYLTNGVLL